MNETMKKAFSYTAVFATGAVACGLALATFGDNLHFLPGDSSTSKHAVLTSLTTVPPIMRGPDTNPIAVAAARVDPAVVRIHTVGRAAAQAPDASPFGNDPIFRHFFGDPGQGPGQGPQTEPVSGAGSGVIISPDGYVLTNNHVVADTSSVTVNVGDKAYDAHVVGTDPLMDIAVVKINTGGVRLPTADLGNSDNVRVGDWAIAVGNPLDIGTTTTFGIISAVNRTGLSAENHPLQSVIQTDAAINPGNSGGALADISGQVIGINEAIESPTGYYSGIGFAIPINSARKIAAELIAHGKVVHPYLGVSYRALSDYTAQERAKVGITLQGDQGVVVEAVSPNSPATRAGLEPGDVVLKANGQTLTDANMLNEVTLAHNVGDTLTLTISRNGKTMDVPVTLQERPADYGVTAPQPQDPQGDGQPQGIPLP